MVQLLVSIEELASTDGATACSHQISQVLAVAGEVDVELRSDRPGPRRIRCKYLV